MHRFINGGVKLIAAGVSGLVGESIQSASQTFCAQTPFISRWRWVRMKRHDAHLRRHANRGPVNLQSHLAWKLEDRAQ
jgi:hypothetical protein